MNIHEIPSYQKDEGTKMPKRPQEVVEEEEVVDPGSGGPGPTNNQVLGLAFYSFLGFTIVQISFAVRANSSAMMADSAAMFVDAGTYLCNMLAEKLKSRPMTESEAIMPPLLLQHRRKLHRLYLELFPPAISVATLLYVTCTTFGSAATTFYAATDDGGTGTGEEEGKDPPNLKIMMFFSILNLLLDAVNFTCFARAEQTILTYDIKNVEGAGEGGESESSPMLLELVQDADDEEKRHHVPKAVGEDASTALQTSLEGDYDELSEDSINLNMCSAFTHVFADTMRSVAVLLTGAYSYFFHGITPQIADAAAALFVSIVIFLSCIPLFRGLWKTSNEIATLRGRKSIHVQAQTYDIDSSYRRYDAAMIH